MPFYALSIIYGGISFHYLDHILVIFQMHLRVGLLSKISTYNIINHFSLIHVSILPQMDGLILQLDLMLCCTAACF